MDINDDHVEDQGYTFTMAGTINVPDYDQIAVDNTMSAMFPREHILYNLKSFVNAQNINRRYRYGETILLMCCWERMPECILYLLSLGADPNISDGTGFCPLHAAVREPSSYVLDLLEAGADVNKKAGLGKFTPIQYAIDFNANPSIIKLLLDFGATMDGADDYIYLETRRNHCKKQTTQVLLLCRGSKRNTLKAIARHLWSMRFQAPPTVVK